MLTFILALHMQIATPMVVPAVRHDEVVGYEHCKAVKPDDPMFGGTGVVNCEPIRGNVYYSCEDKRRVLLTTGGGAKLCVLFADLPPQRTRIEAKP